MIKKTSKLNEEKELSIIFRPNPIIGSSKQLIVSNEFVELNSTGKRIRNFTHIDKDAIVAYKFGINWKLVIN